MAEHGVSGEVSHEGAGAPVRGVSIVGSGLMGTGIAEVCARAGFATTLVKATGGDVDAIRARVLGSLDRSVEKGKLAPEARDRAGGLLTFSADLGAIVGSDLVVESALETLAAKRPLLRQLEELAGIDAVLATNTSALPLRDMAVDLARPERFLGMHFFSPAQIMKLCEVSPTHATSDPVTRIAVRFVEAIGKTPVLVRCEPGYIVNRLLVPYLLQAMELLESGLGDANAIDTAMKLGCGHPVGPLALADYVGLDVVLAMARAMFDEYRDARYRVPSVLRRLVLSNQLGKKSGRGFYVYADGAPVPNPGVFELGPETRKLAAAG